MIDPWINMSSEKMAYKYRQRIHKNWIFADENAEKRAQVSCEKIGPAQVKSGYSGDKSGSKRIFAQKKWAEAQL